MRRSIAAFTAALLLCSSGVLAEPTPPGVSAAAAPPVVDPAPETPFAAALRQSFASPAAAKLSADKEDRDAAAAFYAARGNIPLWTSSLGFTPNAQAVIAELGRADEWGLRSSDFPAPLPPKADSGSLPSAEALARAEMELTLNVLRYARHARGGRIPDPAKMLSSYLDRKPQLKEPKAVLEEIASSQGPEVYLRGLHPQHADFEKLRQEYNRLRTATAEAEALKIPPGPKLKPGDFHPQVGIIRKRLRQPVSVIDGVTMSPDLYDDLLAAKIKAFQEEKGVRSYKGIINDATRAALNKVEVGSPSRLLAAMEEWRWMPADLGKVHVEVNIPEFMVRVVKDGKVVHAERIVAGKIETQTPVFSENMQTVVFHPNWNVPESIKIKELLPRLASGGGLRSDLRMKRNGKVIDPWNVNWERADIRNYEIFQPSGDGNALGELKFLFPNKHSVYLHDTPSKGLFAESTRTFSHGCMRVRNPVKLAEAVLGEDKGWDAAKIKQLLKSGPENNAVTLDKRIPVHVTYFTARIDESGFPRYFRDIYGHEQRISLALDGKWSQIKKNPDHLAPVKPDQYAKRGIETRRRTAAAQPAVVNDAGGLFGAAATTAAAPPPAPPAPLKAAAPKPAKWEAPKWGLTKAPRGNTVGDMITRAFGFSN